jgi:hypothetical protein
MPRFTAKSLLVGIVLMLTGHAVVPAEPERENRPRLDSTSVPETGSSVAQFVPTGWKIEAQVEGDLDRDAVDDIVLTLVEDLPAEDADGIATDRHRALIVLLRRDSGFTRAGSNNHLLLCTRCGGAFYGAAETPTAVSIERGVVIVRQDWGARETTAETHRFRYDPAANRMALIGYDVFSVDRLGPTTIEESTNLLTGDYLRQETRSGEKPEDQAVTVTRAKVARTKVFLEDVTSLNSQ